MTHEDRPLTTAELAGRSGEETPADEAAPARTDEGAGLEPLLPEEETEGFRNRWQEIQTAFVDAPDGAVERADALVAELMQRLAQSFAQERETLEGQLRSGGQTSTEDLRVGLQRYRSFFERLLST